MKTILRPAILLFIILSILTGIIYPLAVTVIGKLFFPHQTSGNLIKKNGQIIGSTLIGQGFKSPKYFWSRPSATADFPYNALASGGSNLGPLNPQLIHEVEARAAYLRHFSAQKSQTIPVDLVTASASGLDPDISVAAALYQIDRIAQARQIPVEKLTELVDTYTQGRQLGLLGEPRVNVLELNLALDELPTHDRTAPQS